MESEPKATILVVEDDAGMQKVLALGLKKMQYQVALASNGKQALDLLEAGDLDPDVVLMDIRMPVMTGLQALPRVRELVPMSPVIMLTAFGDLDTGLDAMKKGAFDYLVKPSSLEKIRETIEKALGYRAILQEKAQEERRKEQYRLDLERRVESTYQELGSIYGRLREMNLQTAHALAEAVEAKDRYTKGHCERVRWISERIGHFLGLADDEIEQLEYAALLHDIGKIGIPDSILLKRRDLDERERQIMRMHPIIGAQILSTVQTFARAAAAVRHHHERWDGQGYPEGARGEEIDRLARIISLADTFDAMVTSRPYRQGIPVEQALRKLHELRGSQFSPEVVDAFFSSGLIDEYVGLFHDSLVKPDTITPDDQKR
ncbi:MAG: response regulator [Spirochaetaceae bacterium]|nr:response regulator [Spirochaetaceae bacterium]